MDGATNQLPHILGTLGQDLLQQLLDRAGKIFPFPLMMSDAEGNLMMSSSSSVVELTSFRVALDSEGHTLSVFQDEKREPESRIASVPLHIHNDVAGYLIALPGQTNRSDEQLCEYLRVIADFICERAYSEYELENLTEELIEKYNEVNLIYDISEALGAVLDPHTVCHVILEKAVEVIGVDKASILLYDEEKDRLYIAASHGIELSDEEIQQILIAPDEGVSGRVFSSRKHLLVENVEEVSSSTFSDSSEITARKASSFPLRPKRYKKKSFLCVPMICQPEQAEKKVMGVINMTHKRASDMFTSGDLRLLTAVASQAAISLYNIQLIEEVKDAERVKREMEIAQQIQMGLLPAEPPRVPGVELAGRCLPATQVGGDYYDFFLSADNKLGMVIADVSGHNVGAALMMAAARSTLRSEVLTQGSPSKILENTNLVLYEDLTHAELFITMFYAEFDTQARTLRYSNGGHNPPILLREGACSFLDTEGMLIGMLESVSFEEKTIQLHANDFVIFYTDGVVEAVNDAGDMFKVHRLYKVIEQHCQQDAHHLLHQIYRELEIYSGSALRSDDITVVVLKVY